MTHSEPIASAASPPSGDAEQRIRGPLAALWLAYAVFVVYGSLVPLDFTPIPWERAWHAFRHIPFLHLGIASRADWVANILLFIPLGFLTPTLLAPRSRAGRWGAAITVLIGCLLASLTIEFVQLFFPPRTVSQNDIMAESLGGLIGVIAWWYLDRAFIRWVTDWGLKRSPASLAEQILWTYLAAMLLYSVLPLDLTISPTELYHKWQQGLLLLIPFSSLKGDPVTLLYAITADALIWTPVSLLWVLSRKKRPMEAWLWTLAAATVVEIAQLFVFSRTTDTTDIITAALGAGVGAVAGARLVSTQAIQNRGALRLGRVHPLTWSLLGLALWSAALMLVFWYPYDFHLERQFLLARVGAFSKVPFYTYYFGTEYRAVTELLHKVLFFAPLGVLLALGGRRLPRGLPRGLYWSLAIAVMLGLPLLIELGQVALPGKYPDNTDWLLEVVGGVLGLVATRSIQRRLRSSGA